MPVGDAFLTGAKRVPNPLHVLTARVTVAAGTRPKDGESPECCHDPRRRPFRINRSRLGAVYTAHDVLGCRDCSKILIAPCEIGLRGGVGSSHPRWKLTTNGRNNDRPGSAMRESTC